MENIGNQELVRRLVKVGTIRTIVRGEGVAPEVNHDRAPKYRLYASLNSLEGIIYSSTSTAAVQPLVVHQYLCSELLFSHVRLTHLELRYTNI